MSKLSRWQLEIIDSTKAIERVATELGALRTRVERVQSMALETGALNDQTAAAIQRVENHLAALHFGTQATNIDMYAVAMSLGLGYEERWTK